MKSAWLCIILIFLAVVVNADSKTEMWEQEQLNETYMRSISKDEYMAKTINSLKVCNSQHCLKTMAGVAGDCVVWASGKKASFCKNYEEKYIKTYCPSKDLDNSTCRLLYALKKVYCKKNNK